MKFSGAGNDRAPLSKHHHMSIRWDEFVGDNADELAVNASLTERTAIVGRIGILFLSLGTGSWRVRDSMNTVARVLGLTCSADVGLLSLSYTCFELDQSCSQTLELPTTGVNTAKLAAAESYIDFFQKYGQQWTVGQIHHSLDDIFSKPNTYSTLVLTFAAALACGSFTFLLGGGAVESLCAFIGAGSGNYIRQQMSKHHITMLAAIAVSVAAACLMYFVCFTALRMLVGVNSFHEAGYIGAMLFVIPGFPFITSILDMAKLDMRSGLERLCYALLIIIIATTIGWMTAMVLKFHPANFVRPNIQPVLYLFLRLIASFCGVFGFSLMFNSTRRMAIIAGCIGAIANTMRLEMIDFTNLPPAAAAFAGALLAGLLASIIRTKTRLPRISITVPATVIMVPGLYFYRAVFRLGNASSTLGVYWLTQAAMIFIALPLGLITARILTDPKWRYNNWQYGK